MKFVFAGTTEFGIPTLEKLMQDHELLFVITQPDKPTGRRQELSPSPIKLWAKSKSIEVAQPEKINEIEAKLSQSNPDLLLVAAYGQIIPKNILNIPKFGSINIHGSILPKYRGASPIQSALLNGETETGITFIQMDEKMDHGPILGIKKTAISPQENFQMLYKKLAELSATAAAEILPKLISGEIQPQQQDHEKATFTKILRKEDGKIDWTHTAASVYNQIRALNPEPGSWTTLDGKIIKILEAAILPEMKIDLPGKIYRAKGGLAVKAQDQSLLISKLQPEGKKPMPGQDFLNGLRNFDTKHFL